MFPLSTNLTTPRINPFHAAGLLHPLKTSEKLKVNKRNTRIRFEIYLKLTIKMFVVNFEHALCYSVSIINFEQVNAGLIFSIPVR